MPTKPASRRAATRGAALIEAIVALVILSIAGLGVVGALEQSLRVETGFREREETMLAASRVMSAMVLLTRTDLGRRLGSHPIGEFQVEVQRPEQSLFRIAVAETRAPGVEALVTVVFRPEGAAP